MVRKVSLSRLAMYGSLMLAAVVFAASGLFSGRVANADSSQAEPAVGVWEVRVGAPRFRPTSLRFMPITRFCKRTRMRVINSSAF